MRYLIFFLIAITGIQSLNAQQLKYSRVRIYADDSGLKKLASEGVTVDHGIHKRGVFFETDLSETEIRIVARSGYQYEVLVDDVKSMYKDQTRRTSSINISTCASAGTNITTPAGFDLGSMGGFYTYAELLAALDTMHARFPNLVTQKAAADLTTTIEGRPVYFVKISDNASSDEPEPEMLYTALHHAREPAGMQQLIFYMYYLLENYTSDPEIQHIINNTELYFIPCINPDGYIENETNDPTGGGMWRKNKRNNGDGTYGVDLNRNYGYFWGYDNTGSSPNTANDTYRGTSGFSEPETQVMKNFAEAHDFKLAINYHTYGNLLVHPWGYESIYTPDSAIFTDFAKALTRENNYLYGTPLQTVGYNTNGGSDDWLYVPTTDKGKIFSFTPEAGNAADGFWPASSQIEDICKSNIVQNLTAAHLIMKYALASDKEPQFITQASGFLNYSVKRLGLDSTGVYTVEIIPISSAFGSTGSPKVYPGMQLLQEINDSISYTLTSAIHGEVLKYVLKVSDASAGFAMFDTITKYYGQPGIAFNSAGNSMTGFTGNWGITNEAFHSSSSSLTDSPFTTYDPASATTLTTSSQVNLINVSKATLTYFAKWEIETGWDYAQVQVSTNNGSTWEPLCGKFTKAGNQYQDPGQPVYDGVQAQWVKEEIDLSAFVNQNIRIRFVMISDNFMELDGFYLDDMQIELLPISPIGIEETNETISVYPNPADNSITLNLQSDNHRVQLFDQAGKKMKEQLCNGKCELDLHDLSAGIYILEVTSDTKRSLIKVAVY